MFYDLQNNIPLLKNVLYHLTKVHILNKQQTADNPKIRKSLWVNLASSTKNVQNSKGMVYHNQQHIK